MCCWWRDNETLGDTTAALLQAHGATVRRAGNAAEALRQLAERPDLDVVLSDVVMPGEMDGIGLARRLQQDRPGLPVVLISGYNTSEAGSDFVVLRKPCAQDTLLATLSAAITQPRR